MCLPKGDRAVLLRAARALARAASVVAVGATVTAAMPRRATGEAADAHVICVPQRVPRPFVDVSARSRKSSEIAGFIWRARRDSNSRPLPSECNGLLLIGNRRHENAQQAGPACPAIDLEKNWRRKEEHELADGEVVGRIYKAHAAPVGSIGRMAD